MERGLANVLGVEAPLTGIARRRWSFAEYEKLDEGANQENDRELTDEKALREGQLRHHHDMSDPVVGISYR